VVARLLASREVRTLLVLALVLGLGAAKEPRLLSAESVSAMVLWLPILMALAIGQMFVIVSRGIDVSVGSALALSGLAAGMLFRSHPELPISLGVGVALLVGIGLGAVNGALVVAAKVPPIIATLGTLSIYRGLALWVSRGEQIDANHLPVELSRWSLEGPFRVGAIVVPWLLIAALGVAALAQVVMRHTLWGRSLYMIGGHPEAARMRGIAVSPSLFWAYLLCGACAGLGGMLYAAQFGFVNPGITGLGFELTVIAATVIGGCDVRGGVGSVPGVLLGCALLAAVNVTLSVLGIAADWQMLAYGAIIVLALLLDALAGRWVTRGVEA